MRCTCTSWCTGAWCAACCTRTRPRTCWRNNRTAPYLWSFIVLTVVPAVLFWRYSGVLLGFCVLFAISYVAAYVMLVRFKVPRIL